MSRIDDTVLPPVRKRLDHPGSAPPRVDPVPLPANQSYRYDRLFFRRLYRLSRPYWTRAGSTGSWLTLFFLLATVVAYSVCGAWITWLTKDQTNALVAKNSSLFWHLLAVTALLTAVRYLISTLQSAVEGCLDLHWHQWMGQKLLDRYFGQRRYYKLAQDRVILDPDQRLQDEAGPFCSMMTSFPRLGLGTLVDALVQLSLMLAISHELFWTVLAFVVFKFVAIVWIYTPVIGQNNDVVNAEAAFRVGIRHVVTHAETVALYRGEAPESAILVGHLRNAVRQRLRRTLYAIWISLMQGGFSTAWLVLPLLFVAPQFLRGEIQYGTIAQSVAATALLLQSLSLFLQFVPTISVVSHKVARLGEIVEIFDHMEPAGSPDEASGPASQDARIEYRVGDGMRLDDVTLLTPGGELELVRDLRVRVDPGIDLAIAGPTGVGKSSLIRAMAGLWTRGSGSITMPPLEQTMFLPQKPYMLLGSLREQLFYPQPPQPLGDAALEEILARVRLPQLTAIHGGLDAVNEWSRVLSLGEQQRIAVARVLLARPRYLFIDEATSAVDYETERLLYEAIREAGVTCISVGHRKTVHAYHRQLLTLLGDGRWEVRALTA